MKKTIACLLAALCLFCCVSCGEKNYEIDPSALARDLLAADCFELPPAEVPGALAGIAYGTEDGVDAVAYRGAGATAEEITVFTAKDAAAATTVLETAKQYIAAQEAIYRKYNAKEADRLNAAIVVRKGKYVVVVVCDDYAAAKAVIDKAFA